MGFSILRLSIRFPASASVGTVEYLNDSQAWDSSSPGALMQCRAQNFRPCAKKPVINHDIQADHRNYSPTMLFPAKSSDPQIYVVILFRQRSGNGGVLPSELADKWWLFRRIDDHTKGRYCINYGDHYALRLYFALETHWIHMVNRYRDSYSPGTGPQMNQMYPSLASSLTILGWV